jgi:hypothetical protein
VAHVERAIYIYIELYVLRNNSSVHSVALSLGFVTHWFSLHHHHHQLQLQLSLSTSPEKGCQCRFLVRPLGFLELFFYSPLSAVIQVNAAQPPAWPLQEPFGMTGREPDGPLELD